MKLKKKSQTFSARGVQRDEKFSALAPRLIMENGKKLLFTELCSFFIDLLEFEPGKLCPGMGLFVSFF